MADSKEITALRKAGKLKEALELGRQLMAAEPTNVWNARAMGWVYFDHLKTEVACITEAERSAKAIPRKAIDGAHHWLKEYHDLPKEIPGMLHSNILLQLAKKVGRHLDSYLAFQVWAGTDCYRPEDLQPSTWEDKTISPLVVKTARECAAWLKARPQELEKYCEFVEAQLQRAVSHARDDDKTWVKWALAVLQRQRGEIEQATKTIAPILKLKRTEFWVWSEAARIYQEEQPELAVACYCQALCCGAESKFLGKTHLELATLLVQQGESAWASKEIDAAASIYDQEGWRHPRELQDALASTWYDPTGEGVDPVALHKEHATEALSLCFDEVVMVNATFLKMDDPLPGKKPKPTFAARLGNELIFIRGRRANKKLMKSKPGSPMRLTLGLDGGKREVIDTLPRPDGQPWDSMDECVGVITRLDPVKQSVHVFSALGDSCWVTIGHETGQFSGMTTGQGMALKTMPNKEGKRRVFHWEPCGLPQNAHIRRAAGILDIKKSGVGFIGDVFVPPHLLDPSLQGLEMTVLAVHDLNPKTNQPNWKAITLAPA